MISAQLQEALRDQGNVGVPAKMPEPGDPIDPATIDLKTEYRKLNRLLFDNELGEYPMRWNNRKSTLARVRSRGIRGRPETVKIHSIEFSKFYHLTREQFMNRLAHEMIHVKLIEKGMKELGGAHGLYFEAERRRINALGRGFYVTAREELPATTELRTRKTKEVVAVLIDHRDGKKTVLPVEEKAWKRVFAFLSGAPKPWLENKNFYLVLSDNQALHRLPIKRSIPRGKFVSYHLPDGEWERIRREGKRLASIVSGTASWERGSGILAMM